MEAPLCFLKYQKPSKLKDRVHSQSRVKLKALELILKENKIQQLLAENEAWQLTLDYRLSKETANKESFCYRVFKAEETESTFLNLYKEMQTVSPIVVSYLLQFIAEINHLVSKINHNTFIISQRSMKRIKKMKISNIKKMQCLAQGVINTFIRILIKNEQLHLQMSAFWVNLLVLITKRNKIISHNLCRKIHWKLKNKSREHNAFEECREKN